MAREVQRGLRALVAMIAAVATLGLGVPSVHADDASNAQNPQPAQESVAAQDAADEPGAQADDAIDWQGRINAADEDDVITFTGEVSGSLTVNKRLTLTAAEGSVFTGSLRINVGGTTVKGMTFKLDPALNVNGQNVIVSNKISGVSITGNTFIIEAGDPATGASQNKDWQPSSIWLATGADATEITGNTFRLGQVVNNSAVGVNIVGNGKTPITNTIIENNTVTSGPISGGGTSGSMMFVVGNGNTQKGSYGITGLTFTGNTVTNGTGLAASLSKTYGIAVTATRGTVIDDNTIEGYAAVSYSVWPSQGPNDDLTVTNNKLDSFAGILLGNYVTDTGLTSKGNTFGEETKYPINGGANLTVLDQDGRNYATIADALKAGATEVTMYADSSEKVAISGQRGVTINGNGHKLSGGISFTGDNDGVTVSNVNFTGTGAPIIDVNGKGNANISVTNNVFDVTNTGTWVVVYVQKTSDGLTIENNVFNMPKVTGGSMQAIGFAGTKDIRATNVTIKGNALNGSGESTGGSVFFTMGWSAAENGEHGVTGLTLEGNTVNAMGGAAVYGAWLRNVDTITVKGNTFAGAVGVGLTSANGLASNKNVTVESNTFNVTNGALYVANGSAVEDSVTTKDNTGFSYTSKTLQASIAHGDGSVDYYTTLADAAAGAADGETVTMLNDTTLADDVAIGKDVTLDLNGRTVDTAGFAFAVKSGGTLTVTGGGKIANTVTASDDKKNQRTMFNVSEGGELVIENGTFETKSSQIVSAAGKVTVNGGDFTNTATADELKNSSGKAMFTISGEQATLAFNAGTIKADLVDMANGRALYGVYAANGAAVTLGTETGGPAIASGYAAIGLNNTTSSPKVTVTVNNGDYKAGLGAAAGKFNSVLYLSGSSDITVNGGTFANTDATDGALFALPYKDADASLTINGGTFKDAKAVIATYANAGASPVDGNSIAVTGGTFSAPLASFEQGASFEKFVTGGTFEPRPDDATIADKLEYRDNGDGTFGVAMHVIATVTLPDGSAKDYDTLAGAIKAATAGATVTLRDNATENITIGADQTITLDLNGLTLTDAGGDTIVNNGTLTVTDSSASKTGVIDNVSHGKAALRNTLGATATLDGGTFKRSKEAGVSNKDNGGNSYYTIQNMGAMTINDGVKVESKLSDGSRSKYSSVIANGFYNGINDNPDEKTAELTINGGVIEGGLYVKNDEYGRITVNGGSIKGSAAAVLNYGATRIAGGTLAAGNDNARVLWNFRDDSSATSTPGELTVTGGVIDATGNQTAIYQNSGEGSGRIAISGGTVNGPIADSSGDPAKNLTITGGVFSIKPDQSYIADDLKFAQNDAGDWTLADAQIIAVEALDDITVEAGVDPTGQLPTKVEVTLDNGLTRKDVPVVWDAMPDTWRGPNGGTIELSGKVGDQDAVKVRQTIVVRHATITSVTVDPAGISTPAGVDPTGQLPVKATVTWSSADTDTVETDVTWDAVKADDYKAPGSFEVEGKVSVDGYDGTVTIKVTVVAAVAVKAEASVGRVSTIATNAPDLGVVKAKVTWSDGSVTSEPVDWSAVDPDRYASAGSFEVSGVVRDVRIDGQAAVVTVTVEVAARVVTAVTPSGDAIEVETATDSDPKPSVAGRATLAWNDGRTSEVSVPLSLPDGWNHPRAAHDVAVTGRVDGWGADVPFTVHVRAAVAVSAAGPAGVSTVEKVAPTLPGTAVVTWSNGETSAERVAWDAYDPALLGKAGKFAVDGVAEGQRVSVVVTVVAATIAGVDSPADVVVTKSGMAPSLPATLTARWSNGTESQVGVVWESSDKHMAIAGGDYELKGTVAGWDGEVAVKVHVDPATPVKLANDGVVEAVTQTGVAPKLPAELDVAWSNGDKVAAAVEWGRIDDALLGEAGTFTVAGTVTVPADASGLKADASGLKADASGPTVTFPVTATITVKADTNGGGDGDNTGGDGDNTGKGDTVVDQDTDGNKPGDANRPAGMPSTGVALTGIAVVAVLLTIGSGVAFSLSRRRD